MGAKYRRNGRDRGRGRGRWTVQGPWSLAASPFAFPLSYKNDDLELSLPTDTAVRPVPTEAAPLPPAARRLTEDVTDCAEPALVLLNTADAIRGRRAAVRREDSIVAGYFGMILGLYDEDGTSTERKGTRLTIKLQVLTS